MRRRYLKIALLCLLIPAVAVGLAALAGSLFIGVSMAMRDKRDLKEFRLVQSVGSPDGKQFALLFEHDQSEYKARPKRVEEIVVVNPKSDLSIPELWWRMKHSKEAVRTYGEEPEVIQIEWRSNSSLALNCLSCMKTSAEMLRRAPNVEHISIEYIGFPGDAPYTNTQPVEKIDDN